MCIRDRAGEEGAGGVRFVVFRKNDPPPVLAVETLFDDSRQVQPGAEPVGQQGQPTLDPLRGEGQIGLQQSLELHQRFVVEANVIEVGGSEAGFFEAVPDGIFGEAGIVFPASEAFFLGRGHDLAIDDQRGGRVVVEGGDSQNRGHQVSSRWSDARRAAVLNTSSSR